MTGVGHATDTPKGDAAGVAGAASEGAVAVAATAVVQATRAGRPPVAGQGLADLPRPDLIPYSYVVILGRFFPPQNVKVEKNKKRRRSWSTISRS